MAIADTPVRSAAPSVPGTPRTRMSSSAGLSPIQIYQNIMKQFHQPEVHIPLRKPKPSYGNDAAGLTNAQRTERTRVRGTAKPSQPPPKDSFYPEYRPSKKFVEGKSFMATPSILEHPDNKPPSRRNSMLGMSMDSALFQKSLRESKLSCRPSSATGERPCIRVNDASFRTSLRGPGLTIISEEPIKRPIRRPGSAAPTNDTKARVMVLADEPSPPSTPSGYSVPSASAFAPFFTESSSPYNSSKEAMLANTWARQSYEAGVTSSFPSRPSTAPASRPVSRHEATSRYIESMALSNLDVYQYRHSGGICPKEYKFDDARMPGPQVESPRPDSARDSYYASRVDYARNRVRAMVSLPQYA